MNQNDYVMEITEVYKKFYSNNAMCPYFESCSKNMERVKIKCDFATRIGCNYGQTKSIPKVMVLGQESVSEHRYHNEPVYSLEEASNEHYRKTLYTLAMIYEGIVPKGYSILELQEYEKWLKYFCLTNYYKCAFSDECEKVNDLEHSKAMKDNCYKLLLDEIETLCPDLLLIQGKFITSKFENALDAKFGQGICLWQNKNKNASVAIYKRRFNNNDFYLITSYHPSAYGYWANTQKDLKTAIDVFRREYYKK